MEPTYYCNLKCPFCPRKINDGERTNQHMKPEIWKKILNEMSENNLPSPNGSRSRINDEP